MTDTDKIPPITRRPSLSPAPLCLTCLGAGLIITLETPASHRPPTVTPCPDCPAGRHARAAEPART